MNAPLVAPELIGPKVVWSPLPGSQELLLACPCNHILYEGTRGPGKTDAQLMKFRRHVGMGYGSFWRGVIFDREYKNLDDLVSKSRRWFPQFGDGARFLSSKSDYKWVWPTGEELLFRVAKRLQDYWLYHGQEFPFIGWNELSKFANGELYDMMMSCNRSSFIPSDYPQYLPDSSTPYFLPEIPLQVVSTTNPFGAGHAWVKRRFIDAAPPGRVVRTVTDVYDPRLGYRRKITKTQVRIFGSYKENRFLSPEYVAELENIRSPTRRRAWLWGDWNVISGGAINDLWDELVHIVPMRFKIPKGWRIDRSFDWGSSKPFSVGWWAEANGEEVKLPDGHYWCPPAGTLIRIYNHYGTEELGSNKGVRKTARAIAREVVEIDKQLRAEGWIASDVQPGPADASIFDVQPTDNEFEPDSIAKQMEAEGCYWTRSDKSAGSRKNGLELLRERLQASIDADGPGFYVMRNCVATLALLPDIPLDEEKLDDVDTESEDHIYDEVRYRILAGNNRAARTADISTPR